MKGFRLNEEQRQLVESVWPYLRKMARRTARNLNFGWDEDLVDDLTTEAVIMASRCAETYVADRARFTTYITTFTPRLLVRAALRLINRRCEQLFDEFAVTHPDRINESTLLDRLPILNESRFDVVRRRFGIGQPSETLVEIAKDMGVCHQAVSRRIDRALIRLYHITKRQGVDLHGILSEG